jgi:glycosyltransferase involved in cell wall biosynthesis
VDNQSTDGTRELVERYVQSFPNIRYVFEEKLGSSAARNRGWNEAKLEYVGFIDDDGKAPPDWLRMAEDIIQNLAPEIFGGPVLPFYNFPKPVWFKDAYASFIPAQDTGFLLHEREFSLYGSNLFIQRSLFNKIGGFDETLGMFGHKLGYGEETEFILRAFRSDPEPAIYYSSDLVAYHLVRAEKIKLRWQIRSRFQLGRKNFLAERPNKPRLEARHILGYILLPFKIIYQSSFGLLLRDKTQFPFPQNYFMERVFESISVWGRLHERLAQVVLKKV